MNGRAQPLAADVDAVVVDDAGALSLPLEGIVGTGPERLDRGLAQLPLVEDAVVVAVSRGGTGLSPTGGGEVVCVSPPLYVDADGDGAGRRGCRRPSR